MVHNVALVDDHHLMRNGLVAMVNAIDGYRISMEAGNGREFIEMLEGSPHPAIAIIDLNMPVMDGFATLAWIREHAPDIKPLALTFDARESAMVKAVHAGARGFLLKSARPEVLRTALDSIILTGYYLDDLTHHALLREPTARAQAEGERERILASITARELEFLTLVCNEQEFTYEQIADTMGVHRRTLDGFRSKLFEKFEVRSKTGLVLFAMRWDLIP